MKAVVVTGVSSGIGLATAALLARRGVHVFGSVRRASDADRTAAACESNFTPLVFDVTDENLIEHAAHEVRNRIGGEPLFGLVNNAGIAVPTLPQVLSTCDPAPQANLTSPISITSVGIFLLLSMPPSWLRAKRNRGNTPLRIAGLFPDVKVHAAVLIGRLAAGSPPWACAGLR